MDVTALGVREVRGDDRLIVGDECDELAGAGDELDRLHNTTPPLVASWLADRVKDAVLIAQSRHDHWRRMWRSFSAEG